MSKALLASPIALALAGCSSPSDPPIPAMPSYATDVQPIFAAHCERCHGADGMLKDGLNDDGTPSNIGQPALCYLSMYDSAGDCTDAGIMSGACKLGALYCATPMGGDPPVSYIQVYALDMTQDEGGMPPKPLPPLSGWEKAVIGRWLENPIP